MASVDPFRDFITAVRAVIHKERQMDERRAAGDHETADEMRSDLTDLSDDAAEKLRKLVDDRVSDSIDAHEEWSHRP